ncbi:MAG: efflux RND transporter periplasmic adaptor subunit [Oligoflexus sp.]
MKQRSKSRKWPWILVVIAIAAAFGAYRYWKQSKVVLPSYQQVSPSFVDITLTVQSTGVVQPQNRLEIKPPIPGRVERVLVQEGQMVKQGQILAWMSSTERAALIDSARARGPEELKRWEELYRQTPILAPINGMIILKNVEPGQTFTSTDAVLVISDRLTVKAQVDETDIAQVKVGQKATIVLDAYSSSPLAAKVDKIAYDAQTINNVTTYLVDVIPVETPAYMRSGMTASVTFVVEEKEQVLAVPVEALKVKRGEYYVLLPSPKPKEPPLEQNVKIGIMDTEHAEILDGLEANQTVLLEELEGSAAGSGGSPFSPFGRRRR